MLNKEKEKETPEVLSVWAKIHIYVTWESARDEHILALIKLALIEMINSTRLANNNKTKNESEQR